MPFALFVQFRHYVYQQVQEEQCKTKKSKDIESESTSSSKEALGTSSKACLDQMSALTFTRTHLPLTSAYHHHSHCRHPSRCHPSPHRRHTFRCHTFTITVLPLSSRHPPPPHLPLSHPHHHIGSWVLVVRSRPTIRYPWWKGKRAVRIDCQSWSTLVFEGRSSGHLCAIFKTRISMGSPGQDLVLALLGVHAEGDVG
jgi:hypothetical protein